MRCINCGKEIEDGETFCKDCRKNMKRNSSGSEVRELEELIEENQKLNELEQTIELDNLSDLVEEEINNTVSEDTVTKVVELPKAEEISTEEVKEKKEEVKEEMPTREELHNEEPKKKNKKKLIIIISIISVVLIAIIISLILILGNKKKPVEEVIDYEKVINEYGKEVENIVNNLIEDDNIPSWSDVTKEIKYKKYDVVCDTHNIYEDGSIYLNKCTVNNKKIKYSYGKEQKEEKGTKIKIYKTIDEIYGEIYSTTEKSGYELAGSITCKNEDCVYYDAYSKYVITKENGSYYLYDYINDTMEYGPFKTSKSLSDIVIAIREKLYAIYNDGDLYIASSGKTISGLSGDIYDIFYQESLITDYGILILKNKKSYTAVSLKKGEVSYTINGKLEYVYQDPNNKIIHFVVSDDSNNLKIYNIKGKDLFNINKIKKYYPYSSDSIVVATDTKYYVYDKNLNKKFTSSDYDKIIGLDSEYVVALKDKDLVLLDYSEKEIAKFEFEMSDNLEFDKVSTDNDICISFKNTKVKQGTAGYKINYYYNSATGEVNKEESEW